MVREFFLVSLTCFLVLVAIAVVFICSKTTPENPSKLDETNKRCERNDVADQPIEQLQVEDVDSESSPV
jgi:hypothetical protein